MRICKDCGTRLSVYNTDKRNLCHRCIRLADKDVIQSPAAAADQTRRAIEMRRKAQRNESKHQHTEKEGSYQDTDTCS